jgi:hypothetical protein
MQLVSVRKTKMYSNRCKRAFPLNPAYSITVFLLEIRPGTPVSITKRGKKDMKHFKV